MGARPALVSHGFPCSSSILEVRIPLRVAHGHATERRGASVPVVAHVGNGADGIDDALAVVGGKIHETNAHPGIAALAQHPYGIDPLHLTLEHERVLRSGWRETQPEPRPDL